MRTGPTSDPSLSVVNHVCDHGSPALPSSKPARPAGCLSRCPWEGWLEPVHE